MSAVTIGIGAVLVALTWWALRQESKRPEYEHLPPEAESRRPRR